MSNKKFSLAFFLFVTLTLLSSNNVLAQQTIIGNIHLVMPSIVEVHAKGTALFKGPQGNIIDQTTGQLVQLKGIRAAEINNSALG